MDEEHALKALSDEIWEHPELCFSEHHACKLLTSFLAENQLGNVSSIEGLQTAFKAEYVTSAVTDSTEIVPCAAFFSEYDALPDIGHACGHNLIAVVGLGAYIKAIKLLEEKKIRARVILYGSPAEEGGGGKVLMMEKGILDGVDMALMAHPSAVDAVEVSVLAMVSATATFHGKSVHGVRPWMGYSALDAAVNAYNNINSLRHRMHPSWRIHGIFTDGGKAPNVIPERAQLKYFIRTTNRKELEDLVELAKDCFKAGAMAAGCTVDIEMGILYDRLKQNEVLGRKYQEFMESKGVQFLPRGQKSHRGSTDMGNVSQAVPSLHPWYSIPCNNAPGHTVEFAAAAKLPESFTNSMLVAEALAHAAVSVLSDEQLLTELKLSKEF